MERAVWSRAEARRAGRAVARADSSRPVPRCSERPIAIGQFTRLIAEWREPRTGAAAGASRNTARMGMALPLRKCLLRGLSFRRNPWFGEHRPTGRFSMAAFAGMTWLLLVWPGASALRPGWPFSTNCRCRTLTGVRMAGPRPAPSWSTMACRRCRRAARSPIARTQLLTPSENLPNVVRYCIAYVRGHRLGEVGIGDISKTLQQENTFVWLALREPGEALLLQMQQQFDLHELAIEDTRVAHQRPKLEQYGNLLFIVLKTAKLGDEQVQLGETHMFVGARFFITVRHGPSTTYRSVRERLERTRAAGQGAGDGGLRGAGLHRRQLRPDRRCHGAALRAARDRHLPRRLRPPHHRAPVRPEARAAGAARGRAPRCSTSPTS
ncbi:MAG: hypothetical protein MZV70_39790 [Desulfobacterales bacterium]|nr:hypothetical protein [Desulfobacterales bacterium]